MPPKRSFSKNNTVVKRLPREIVRCINGHEIDLSSASEYWLKCAEAALPRIKIYIEKRDSNRYEIVDDSLFEDFLNRIKQQVKYYYPKSLKDHHPNMSEGDWIARFLSQTAQLFGRIDQGPTEPNPYLVWPDDRPISEAWQGLGELSVPMGDGSIVYEDPGNEGKLRLPTPGEYTYPRIKTSIRFERDQKTLPKITIEIEGSPVCVLMKAFYELRNPNERRQVRKEAARIWASLFKYISHKKTRNGRPQEQTGKEAAHMRYHERLSWTQIADKLCWEIEKHRPPHRNKHIIVFKENFRKQAEQFFQRIKRHTLKLPPVILPRKFSELHKIGKNSGNIFHLDSDILDGYSRSMTEKFANIKARQAIRALEKGGWFIHEQTGSHVQMKHLQKPGRLTIPYHVRSDVPKGILKSIIRQAGLTNKEFFELLAM